MLSLFLGRFEEVLLDVFESDVITVEIERLANNQTEWSTISVNYFSVFRLDVTDSRGIHSKITWHENELLTLMVG